MINCITLIMSNAIDCRECQWEKTAVGNDDVNLCSSSLCVRCVNQMLQPDSTRNYLEVAGRDAHIKYITDTLL